MIHLKKKILALSLGVFAHTAYAQNPIVQTCYTADPAPMVDGDRLYVHIDRDLGVKDNGEAWYVMNEYRVYSTADMVNWTDHGAALPLSKFTWSVAGSAWASQCIRKGSKYYWYICCEPKSGGRALAVASSTSPAGPFNALLGKPLLDGSWDFIDPSPFIDDNGQAYIVFGNPGCYIAKLTSNMTAFNTSFTIKGNHAKKTNWAGVWEFVQDEASFGGPKEIPEGKDKSDYKDLYEEGPWLMKRDSIYYLMYAAGGVPEHIAYSTSDSPTGPWTYRGQIMRLQDTGSFTNHSGIVTFKDHNYFFYHTGWLPGGSSYKRSTCVEEFKYNADGTIPEIKATETGVSPIATLNPYTRQQAETINYSKGITTAEESEVDPETGKKVNHVYVTDIHANDFIKVRNVEFGDSVGSLTLRLRSTKTGGTIQVRCTKTGTSTSVSSTSTLVGSLRVPNTEGEWEEFTIDIKSALKDIKDVYFKFTGSGTASLFDFDWWRFNVKSDEETSIESMTTNGKKEYYSLSGTKLGSPQRGVNIVVMPDGRKVKQIKN